MEARAKIEISLEELTQWVDNLAISLSHITDGNSLWNREPEIDAMINILREMDGDFNKEIGILNRVEKLINNCESLLLDIVSSLNKKMLDSLYEKGENDE